MFSPAAVALGMVVDVVASRAVLRLVRKYPDLDQRWRPSLSTSNRTPARPASCVSATDWQGHRILDLPGQTGTILPTSRPLANAGPPSTTSVTITPRFRVRLLLGEGSGHTLDRKAQLAKLSALPVSCSPSSIRPTSSAFQLAKHNLKSHLAAVANKFDINSGTDHLGIMRGSHASCRSSCRRKW